MLHNIYGAGALGSVGEPDDAGAITSGGSTIITISGGIVGYDGNENGNVFGAARGNAASTQEGIAQVKTTSVTISGTTTTTQIKGSVYGGGQMGDVQSTTAVDVQGGAIAKNVFGGGMGDASTFTCAKAMVGIADEGACADPGGDNKNKGTSVTISKGTVGTLGTDEKLVDGTGNVYGGGEIARVEWNTQVTISGTPDIKGNVFGAGKGLETHGYSALVRGNSTVTIQGSAKVGKNVYGGGEKATVGRYWVKGIPAEACTGETKPNEADYDVPDEMPYKTRRGGKCTVIVQGSAQIGYNGAAKDAGHVFGAGKGVEPDYKYNAEDAGDATKRALWSKRMVDYNSSKHETLKEHETWDYSEAYTAAQKADENFKKYVWEYFTTEAKYLEFLQSLALVTGTDVTIGGGTVVSCKTILT